jgi:hypothetical protein
MTGSVEISGVDALRSIDLVWTLRDIKAKRTLLPIDPDHLQELVDRGFVEMNDDAPVLTNTGIKSSIDIITDAIWTDPYPTVISVQDAAVEPEVDPVDRNVSQRVACKNSNELGIVVDVDPRRREGEMDRGMISYYRPGAPGNVKLLEPPGLVAPVSVKLRR